MKTILFEGKLSKIVAIKALSKISKRAYHLPISPVRKVTLPDPKLPGNNWVRVKNILSGICGSDMTFYTCGQQASMAFYPMPGSDITYLGHETVGRLVEVGSDCGEFNIGDRVVMRKYMSCCDINGVTPLCPSCQAGNFAACQNYGVVPQNKVTRGAGFGDSYIAPVSQLMKVDDCLSDTEAMLIEPFAVSLHSVCKHIPAKGDNVLVIGAGMIGLNIIQFVKHFQPHCTVHVIERNPNKQDIARKLGADNFLSGELYQAVCNATGATMFTKGSNTMVMGGFDVIYDCVGKGKFLNHTLRWLKAHGTLVKVGYQMSSTKFDETPIWWQGLHIIGVDSHGTETIDGKQLHSFDYVHQLMANKQIITDGFVTHTFKLDNYKKAFKLLIENPTNTIKVVLDCQ